MKVLVTGANGFVGKNLIANLQLIEDVEILPFDIDTNDSLLDEYCAACDFVFHLAGVNRPDDPSEFMSGNFGFSSRLLDTLKSHLNTAPVMLSSSIQASLTGRFADSEYGRSKLAGEELFFSYAKETGAKVLVYRFPGLFGKWSRPEYNSVVATFCHHVANDMPIRIDNPDTTLELCYIDDVIEELIRAINGNETKAGEYCRVPISHEVSLGRIVELLESFKSMPESLIMPNIPAGSFEKKLYSTYLSFMPTHKVCFDLVSHADNRGSFTEILKTADSGQFSVNITKPGVTKGQHWHNSKWELFVVVSGEALIRQRKINSDEVIEYKVTGEHLQAVYMIPGYTHSIQNISDTKDLVTLMWANEQFDSIRPDTFFKEV